MTTRAGKLFYEFVVLLRNFVIKYHYKQKRFFERKPKMIEYKTEATASNERERIIKLLEENIKFLPYPSIDNRLLSIEALIALIKGENK